MRKLYILCFLCILGRTYSQNKEVKYGFELGFGTSRLLLESKDFTSYYDINMNGTLFSNYSLSEDWALYAGLGFDRIISKFKATNYSALISSGTDATSEYQILLSASDFSEKIQLNYIDLPLGLTYKYSINDGLNWCTSFGVKFSFPISSHYSLASELDTRLYYPSIMRDASEAVSNIADWGLYDDKKDWNNSTGSLETTIKTALWAQSGLSYKLNKNLQLIATVYASYGLNKAISTEDHLLLEVDASSKYTYHSVASFNETHVLSFGLKLGLLFGCKKKKQDAVSSSEVVIYNNKEALQIIGPEAVANIEKMEAVRPVLAADTSLVVKDTVRNTINNTLPEVTDIDTLSVDTAVVGLSAMPQDSTMRNDGKEAAIAYIEKQVFRFNFDTYLMQEAFSAQLDSIAKLMIRYDLDLIINGHTDSRGLEAMNYRISVLRAENVKYQLVLQKVKEDKIKTVGYGESQPLITHPVNNQEYSLNRRVEFKIQ